MTDRPPRTLWLAPALVAALRAVPWLVAVTAAPTGAGVLPPIGYNPKDWLQYAALVRQAAGGAWFVANPFTTAPQDGRYLLGLLDVLGRVCRWTGADPFTVLELSRIPLLFALLVALWHASGVVLADRRERAAACWLVLLAGGFEALVDRLVPYLGLPETIAWQVNEDLWHLKGWSTFAACYNPIWVAALALTVATLVPVLRAGGPAGPRDAARVGVGLLALGVVHPYSAIVVVAVVACRPALGWLLDVPGGSAGLATAAIGLVPAALLLGVLSAWQNGDAVYRETATGVLGPQALSIAWYPVTLGAVGLFALRGWRWWIARGETGRLGLAAWTVAVIMLHSSTVANGYHFVFHLWPPLCFAAAPAFVRTLGALRRGRTGWFGIAVVLVLLFQSPLTLTAKCVDELEMHRIRKSGVDVLAALASLPPGNVLASPDFGNYVPAYTGHRVYAGHWFLTPHYPERAQEALAAISGRLSAQQLTALLDREAIRYVVLPAQIVPTFAAALGARVARTIGVEDFAILVVEPAR